MSKILAIVLLGAFLTCFFTVDTVDASTFGVGLHQQKIKPGRLNGFIRDSMRKILPGQKIEVVNKEGKVIASAVSDKYGMYQVKSLSEGEYILKVGGQDVAKLVVTREATVSTIQIVMPAKAIYLSTLQWTLIGVGGTAVAVGSVAVISHNNDSSHHPISP